MESKNSIPVFSEEQKEKIKKLRRSCLIKSASMSIIFASSCFLSNFVVLAIDTFYVRNQAFAICGIALNFFLCFRSYKSRLEKEHDRVRLEVKKILENS